MFYPSGVKSLHQFFLYLFQSRKDIEKQDLKKGLKIIIYNEKNILEKYAFGYIDISREFSSNVRDPLICQLSCYVKHSLILPEFCN